MRRALCLVLVAAGPVCAAFEWDHPSPRSWIAGDSPYRWPAADVFSGWRVDLALSRPWSWPDLRANAVRAAFARSRTAVGWSLAQLASGLYRETRLAASWEEERGGQRLAMVASLLDLRGGLESEAALSGAELDLGWSTELAWFRMSASATGILQTSGAALAGAPRTYSARVRSASAGAVLEGRYEDGTLGRRFAIGLEAPLGPLRLGAGWSSSEPTVRCMAEVRRGAIALSGGVAWHAELPPSETVALAIGSRPAEP